MSANLVSKAIVVQGIVQGVGFRPFVYNCALSHHLCGHVSNTGAGVVIHIEGDRASVDAFLHDLQYTPPALSQIDTVVIKEAAVKSYTGFEILQSSFESKTTSVSPDIAVCDDCLREMRNPHDRRFDYALINCTQCGPRYTIIETLPYDRKNTSMKAFKMCEACEAEYTDPGDRRYHAQPVSCHECGPTLTLYDNRFQLLQEGHGAIKRVSESLYAGKIVALKGIGGFHLMCDATNKEAVATLRERKKRLEKPFAVMFPDLKSIGETALYDMSEEALLQSRERPIVLLQKKASGLLADNVAPAIGRIGAMLPYTPLHHLLFQSMDRPLVATSANRSDEPIYRSSEELLHHLGEVVDMVLDINRDIVNAIDDPVVQIVQNRRVTLRLGRGYAPLTLRSPLRSSKKILAVGAQQKNSIALAFDDKIVLSPHIGDLGSIEAFEYFERTIETFKRFYDFEPDLIVCDQHPEYATSRWAKEQPLEMLAVQHHYAHVLACMLEHNLQKKVLAFAFDGTGYGDDKVNGGDRESALGCNFIWGGEVFVCDIKGYERIGHLKPFRLLGGENAIKEPRRIALSLLFECYTEEELHALNLPLLKQFSRSEIALYRKAWSKGLNAPFTSSMGRLFDAVASLMDLLHVSSYEGQSGLLIEAACHNGDALPFAYDMKEGVIDPVPMIKAMSELVQIGQTGQMADRFINTLVAVMVEFAAQEPTLPIVFSGGVFQNKTLLSRSLKRLEAQGRECYFQQRTPINDGSIALGQIAYAMHREGGRSCE